MKKMFLIATICILLVSCADKINGGWYAFGFLLGIGALTGGASSSTKKK